MIRVFSPTDKIFLSNGDKVISPLKATIHKEDNGDYYLDIETDLSYINYIVSGNIVVAPTPTGEQPFRIGNPQRTRKKISCKCYHVFYDSQNYLIEDSYVVDKNCNDALDHLNMATEPQSIFTTISDIQTIDSYRCVRKSLYEAIKTVLERWGGHLVRDGFSIGIRSSIGADNGVTIRYGKNLKDIEVSEDWNSVVTKIMPVGKDGIMLPETYLEADVSYPLPYTKTVSFSQSIEKDEGETDESYEARLITDLRDQAQSYLDENCKPKVTYTIKANVEKVSDVGDTIEVIDERLGINLLTHIVSFDYDCILGQFKEITFGNTTEKLSGLVSNLTQNATSKVDSAVNSATTTITAQLNDNLETAYYKIWETMGSSYVFYNGDIILVVDSLPKETAKNCMLISSGGIAFSNSGINGKFTSAWTIDGTFNAQNINVINFVADLIKGGTLKLGSNLNEYGSIELYDESNKLIGELNKAGLTMYATDGSKVQLNPEDGLVGYDMAGNKIYWIADNEFHMKKSVIEEEITLCNKVRFIPITITDSSGSVTNEGIGLVPTLS